MRATYSPSIFGTHHIFCRHGLSAFSAKRRRTVSRDRLACLVSRTISPARSSSVQRARPKGGFAQAVATSSASSGPESLRAAPGRGSSLRARSKLPSTKRRLVRYTVEPPTATPLAMSSSGTPRSAAKRIWALELAGRVPAAAEHRLELGALGLAQLNPVEYVHLGLPRERPAESADESSVWRMP